MSGIEPGLPYDVLDGELVPWDTPTRRGPTLQQRIDAMRGSGSVDELLARYAEFAEAFGQEVEALQRLVCRGIEREDKRRRKRRRQRERAARRRNRRQR